MHGLEASEQHTFAIHLRASSRSPCIGTSFSNGSGISIAPRVKASLSESLPSGFAVPVLNTQSAWIRRGRRGRAHAIQTVGGFVFLPRRLRHTNKTQSSKATPFPYERALTCKELGSCIAHTQIKHAKATRAVGVAHPAALGTIAHHDVLVPLPNAVQRNWSTRASPGSCPEHVLTDELIAFPNTQKGRRPPFALAALGSPDTSQDIKSHSQEPQP